MNRVSGLLGQWCVAHVLLTCVFYPTVARAQTVDNVLVVINENSPASVAVGGHYVKARTVGREHVVLQSRISGPSQASLPERLLVRSHRYRRAHDDDDRYPNE